MFYSKQGFPEDSEVVMCTITKILPHSVFVRMDEYGKSGMIHISEIAPGRIRNLNDYVSEGKKVVCKVLSINREKGHIDLSLRRVAEGQRREKVNQLKKEQKAEKIIEIVAKDIKLDPRKLYQDITKNIFQDYEYLHEFFEDVVNEEADIKKANFPEKLEKPLSELIHQRMAAPEVTIEGELSTKSYAPNGVEIIKNMFEKIKDKNISNKYLGGGRYKIIIKGKDYDSVEKKYKSKLSKIISQFQKEGVEAEFKRK